MTHLIKNASHQTGSGENTLITPLRDGAISPVAGGTLFNLPVMYQTMMAAIGSGATPPAVSLKKTGWLSMNG